MEKLYYVKKQYYLKDKKAQIYKYVKGGVDEDGFPIADGYKPVSDKPLWCYTKQLSQDQILAAAAYGDKEERLFIFNYRDDVKLYDLIKYKDKWYSITRVDTTDDYKTELFIYAKGADEHEKNELPNEEEDDENGGSGSGSGSNIIGYDEDGYPIYG